MMGSSWICRGYHWMKRRDNPVLTWSLKIYLVAQNRQQKNINSFKAQVRGSACPWPSLSLPTIYRNSKCLGLHRNKSSLLEILTLQPMIWCNLMSSRGRAGLIMWILAKKSSQAIANLQLKKQTAPQWHQLQPNPEQSRDHIPLDLSQEWVINQTLHTIVTKIVALTANE